MSASAAGGVDKRSLEMEMNSVLGGVPELSTISSSEPISLATIQEDTKAFRTQHPYILALGLVMLGLLVGGCIAYTTGFVHGVSALPPSPGNAQQSATSQTNSKGLPVAVLEKQMNKLQKMKVFALESEDYDAAKMYKGQIDALTAQIEDASKAPIASHSHSPNPTKGASTTAEKATTAPTAAATAVTTAGIDSIEACKQCRAATTPHGYSCIARIQKYLNDPKNAHRTPKQIYTIVANEEHHSTHCAICDHCDPPAPTTAPTTPPTKTQSPTASTAPTAAAPTAATTTAATTAKAQATAKPTPFVTLAKKAETEGSAFDPTDCAAKNGGHPKCVCPKEKNEDYHWSFYDGYLDNKPRPTAPYAKHPTRDVPDKAFTAEMWQSDTVYVNHFIDAGAKLVTRAKEAIYEEYGHGEGAKANEAVKASKASREKMFEILKPDIDIADLKGWAPGEHVIRGGWTPKKSWEGLVKRILHAIHTEDEFVVVLGGHSGAAGHGNNFVESYMMQFHQIMEPVFRRLGVRLVTRNMAMGGLSQGHASLAGTGIWGSSIDMMIWDTGMTETAAAATELFYRQAMQAGDKVASVWSFDGARTRGFSGNLYKIGADIGEFGNSGAGITPTTDAEQAETLPYAVGYHTGFQYQGPKKFDSICWVDRPDVIPPVKQGTPGGRGSWHIGWRQHQLRGRTMAFTVLDAISEALELWQSKTIAGEIPLPAEHWHLTPKYSSIREKLKTFTGACETGMDGFFPRLCRSPMHGIGVYGPRANPMDDGLLKHLVLDPETIYPKYPLPLYDPPDLPYPYQTLPDGAVDVRKVVGARRCPGVTDRRFENEVVQKYQAWKKASLNIPRISSTVVYPTDAIGKERTDICTDSTKKCCIATPPKKAMNSAWDKKLYKEADSMGCSVAGYEPVVDPKPGCGAGKISYKCVYAGKVIPGDGWSFSDVNTGNCDGTISGWCGKANTSKCLMYGSGDARTTLAGNSLSGWLVMRLPKVKNGIIAYRHENWHNSIALYDKWASTKGWTKPNDGKHNRRLLGRPGQQYSANTIFDVSLNGKITSYNADQMHVQNYNSYSYGGKAFEHVYKVLDDETLIGKEQDYELGFRLRNGAPGEAFAIAIVYYS